MAVLLYCWLMRYKTPMVVRVWGVRKMGTRMKPFVLSVENLLTVTPAKESSTVTAITKMSILNVSFS